MPQTKSTLDAALPELLLPWYWQNSRDLPWRRDADAYHIWISEIMLQQTRVETVVDYYYRFLAAFPDVEHLANADIDSVLKLWEGLGYYSRARNLHRAAKEIMAAHHGRFPDTYEAIRALPGIGPYTAGAIASIAFELPTPAVDGNVLRVVMRITEDFRCIDLEKTKKEITRRLAAIYPPSHRGDFTQSLMELGATVCLPNGVPLCEKCPLGHRCLARQNDSIARLPVRKEKTPRKQQDKTFFLLQSGGKIALEKTEAKGVLHGLWALPSANGLLSRAAAAELLTELDLAPFCIIDTRRGKHIFTHIQWNILCYSVICHALSPRFRWVTPAALAEEISLPTAFRKFLPAEQEDS